MSERAYYAVARTFHWIVAGSVGFQFLTAWIMPGVRRSTNPAYLVNIHMTYGAILLPFVALFFASRFFRPARPPYRLSKLNERLAKAVHHSIYALLFLVPLTGLAYATWRGWTVTIFGAYEFPHLFAGSPYLRLLAELHGGLATILGYLVLGHIGAALYHHFVLRDEVLVTMLPWAKRSVRG